MEESKIEPFTLTCEKGERKYILHLDPKSPLGEVHDVLYDMIQFVLDKMKSLCDESKTKVNLTSDMEEK